MGRNTQVGMAQKINLTMEFEKNYIKMKERGKGIYLDQMGRDFTGGCSRNSLLKLWAQMHYVGLKNSNGMKIFIFFTIYRKKLKFLPTFYSFLPFLIILDRLN